jgi:hypothetical protein
MHTRSPITRGITIGIPMLFIAVLTTQCSENTTDAAPGDAGTTGVIRDGSTPNGSATDAGSVGNNAKAPATGNMVHLYPGDRPVPTTPEEERSRVISDMHGLRSILVADLEMVRARLNVGTQPEVQSKADQVLAADLAQGLERVDRALVALDASTDATWSSMRTSQLKEVQDVREWMVDYRGRPESRF